MPDKIVSKTEGDVNLTEERARWQKTFISEESQKLLEEDGKYFLHQALSTPCLDAIAGVDGIYIIDEDGRKFMDFHGNSVHQLGYNNPYLVDAMKKQLSQLSFSPRRYSNRTATALAKKLTSLMPGEGWRVLFTTSGASSNSIALKIARKVTGKHKTISLWDAFHGANLDTISIGGEAHFRSGIGPLLPGCEHVMPYNSYRCPFGDCKECGLKCIDYIEYVCRCEGDIGAIIMEPVRCTDVQIPPAEYYRRLRKLCDDFGIVLIFDEIPTAFGRTGKMFAFQNYDIEPDILVVGKGLGGSLYPVSAVIARPEYNICGDISLGHYTHEKSPLGCAVGLALIEYIEKEDILGHVMELSALMKRRAEDMKKKYEAVGDVRLIGALLGIELVKSRKTREKAVDEAEKILYECLENGLSFKISQGNVLTLAPPLIITEEELDHAMDIVENAIRKYCN
ncbi:MAG TPA: aspartate aminotransferase family protein [Candidatus Copromorpha excrementavium]|uniref:Aspartate aminotransferase family protein n=1 Tax=Candidatus Allocopromorpha excrementavium TaxID=2840741 RepID=A0A9D1KUY3_9FIRM|nr:aspartate aminotransferase family protein [Candidatus Copromorpha excrementavium]